MCRRRSCAASPIAGLENPVDRVRIDRLVIPQVPAFETENSGTQRDRERTPGRGGRTTKASERKVKHEPGEVITGGSTALAAPRLARTTERITMGAWRHEEFRNRCVHTSRSFVHIKPMAEGRERCPREAQTTLKGPICLPSSRPSLPPVSCPPVNSCLATPSPVPCPHGDPSQTRFHRHDRRFPPFTDTTDLGGPRP